MDSADFIWGGSGWVCLGCGVAAWTGGLDRWEGPLRPADFAPAFGRGVALFSRLLMAPVRLRSRKAWKPCP